jgi:lipoprotein-releasing system permease protein
MNLSLFLAKKYYFSKSRKSFVNKISALAIVIIALMVVAEIVVLSVFNGFSDQLMKIHESFDADLEIKAKKGKVFSINDDKILKIKELNTIQSLTKILEDDAILDYNGKQDVVRFKGVETNFFEQNKIKKSLNYGIIAIFDTNVVKTVIGIGLEYKFDINLKNEVFLRLMYPNRFKKHLSKSQSSYKDLMLKPVGLASSMTRNI